ncbi:carboxypeptidase-like regulatory domain-containing protein, partial [candidate division KSB1 bacterium]
MIRNVFNIILLVFVLIQPGYARQTSKSRTLELLKTRITIEFKDTPLPDAVSMIEDKVSIHFNYLIRNIPEETKITRKFDNIPAEEVLKNILSPEKIELNITNEGQVMLVKAAEKDTTASNPKFTLSGYITDSSSGEALVGTNIYVEALRAGCTTNNYGFYSLTIPAGDHEVQYSYIGYETEETSIGLYKNINKDLELKEAVFTSDMIVVTGEAEDKNVKSNEIGAIKLNPQSVKFVPSFLGELDILKTIHLLPGVTSSREGDSGFYVRGGNSDQNLVLLDEASIYNAFHFFGFFSVFNSDALKDVKLYKGPSPAKYGGKLSSVLDIQMKEGNIKEYEGSGGIGLIFSRFLFQGPIKKDKSSFMISARRTYADMFLKLSNNEEAKQSRMFFYDLNLKTNYILGENDRLFVSGYFGKDLLGFSDIFELNWGNKTATVRWNHIFNQKLFSNTSLIYSDFNYEMGVFAEDNDDDEVNISSNIKNTNVKSDFQYFIDSKNSMEFGLNYANMNFLPGVISVTGGNDVFNAEIGNRRANESDFYFSHETSAIPRLKINYGARYSMFSTKGEEDIIDEFIDDDIVFHKKEETTYKGLEPRITANFSLTNTSSIKAGFARNFQYIHLLSKSTSGTPLDVWQPSSSIIKPQRADQVSLGYFQNFRDNTYEASVEVYNKDMKNLTDYKNGADIFLTSFFESELVFGRGWAYGIEFLLKKNTGKLNGWIGYSLAKSKRQFADINNGKPFNARYDRT